MNAGARKGAARFPLFFLQNVKCLVSARERFAFTGFIFLLLEAFFSVRCLWERNFPAVAFF